MKIIVILGLLYIHAANGQTPSNRTCTNDERLPIYDGTCRNFHECISTGSGFISLEIACKSPALFNPDTQLCDSSYACEQSTAPPTTTVAPCRRYGRFEIADPNCQKYYLCFWDGSAYQRWDLSCPNSLIYDPQTEKCTLPQNYVCPSS